MGERGVGNRGMITDLESLVKNARPQFEPGVLYSPEAESLHIFISGEDSVAHVVDEHLTIYEGRDVPRVTGIFFEAVLQRHGGGIRTRLDDHSRARIPWLRLLAALGRSAPRHGRTGL